MRDRVLFTFNQALLQLYRYPEIWYVYPSPTLTLASPLTVPEPLAFAISLPHHPCRSLTLSRAITSSLPYPQRAHVPLRYDLACYELQSGGVDAALSAYERAVTATDSALILRFAHADLLESLNRLDQYVPSSILAFLLPLLLVSLPPLRTQQELMLSFRAKAVYEELLRSKPSPLVHVAYMRFARRAFGVRFSSRPFLVPNPFQRLSCALDGRCSSRFFPRAKVCAPFIRRIHRCR